MISGRLPSPPVWWTPWCDLSSASLSHKGRVWETPPQFCISGKDACWSALSYFDVLRCYFMTFLVVLNATKLHSLLEKPTSMQLKNYSKLQTLMKRQFDAEESALLLGLTPLLFFGPSFFVLYFKTNKHSSSYRKLLEDDQTQFSSWGSVRRDAAFIMDILTQTMLLQTSGQISQTYLKITSNGVKKWALNSRSVGHVNTLLGRIQILPPTPPASPYPYI